MKFTQRQLINILEKASTLSERLENRLFVCDTECDNNTINSRIDKWCKIVAGGKWNKFSERLSWDNLEIDSLRPLMGEVRLQLAADVPDWLIFINEALEYYNNNLLHDLKNNRKTKDNRFIDFNKPLPFEELFIPFVLTARKKLSKQNRTLIPFLSNSAQVKLERYLLKQLSNIALQTLHLKFSVFRTLHASCENGRCEGNSGLYHEFIQKMYKGEILSLFQDYSVLTRLIATIATQWVANICEFLARLNSDYQEIQTAFQLDQSPGKIIDINPGISDRHQNGQTVLSVTFESGLNLIYKPKNLGFAKAYNDFIDWLNQYHELNIQLKSLIIINRAEYGWVEFVNHTPLMDVGGCHRYYQRAGMLLCLFYVLRGIDCHYENIIACGEHPVVIDVETLIHPKIPQYKPDNPEEKQYEFVLENFFTNTVLNSSFMPIWQTGMAGQSYDQSGFWGTEGQETGIKINKLINTNTDAMTIISENARTHSVQNMPILNDTIQPPLQFKEDFITGFSRLYHFFVKKKDTLLAANGPLNAFRNKKGRVIFRLSQYYSDILTRSLHPKYLHHGIDRSIYLEIFASVMLTSDTKPNLWPLQASEKRALEQLDIPCFKAYPDKCDIETSTDEKLSNSINASGFDLVTGRILNLGKNDLEKQIDIIRTSLFCRATGEHDLNVTVHEYSFDQHVTEIVHNEELENLAVSIAHRLKKTAIYSSDGKVSWFGIEKLPGNRFNHYPVINYNLYHGSCGIALFLAAVANITGDKKIHMLTLDTLKPLLNNLNLNAIGKVIDKIGLGAAAGYGSLMYSLVRIGTILNNPDFIEHAARLVDIIDEDRINKNSYFDVNNGSSGAILGLITLYEETDNTDALKKACLIGEQLLQNRTQSDTGFKSWKTVGENLCNGFAHGASGIANALIRLFKHTLDKRLLNAAEDAFAYERHEFFSNLNACSDINICRQYPKNTSWCYGATGIGLARLVAQQYIKSQAIIDDFNAAMKIVLSGDLQQIDHLCCGNFGKIEFLFTSGQKLALHDYQQTARQWATLCIARAKQAGNFRLFPNLPEFIINPGFFQGISGIGYELLRLAHPQLLPSVLIWE
ncbi:type 2 lantipeptide synthetase LanM family protein [candidate division KSB1 bacterium]|nr:type 2 lantipeptide synthetase LanM family protein [candidate division KSB1 bacterium]